MSDNLKKITQTEQAILNAVAISPEKSNHQIAMDLIKVGQIRSVEPVYRALRKKDYMRVEVGKLRERIREDHTRHIFPLAQTRLKTALKNKDLDEKTALPYVKLVYDKEMDDKQDQSNTVNMVSIDKMQVIMRDIVQE